jgi:hypothetical protein
MIYFVDPAQPGHYPTCPFKWVTGLDCPGCGSMRALHQILHGHPLAAANYNVLFVAFAPFLVLVWVVGVLKVLGVPVRVPQPPRALALALPVVVAVFWVVRNTPTPIGHWLHS